MSQDSNLLPWEYNSIALQLLLR